MLILDRRSLLLAASALAARALLRDGDATGLAPRRAPVRLLLLELSGGNDGLTLLAPRGNDDYERARPQLARTDGALLPLDDRRALHPAFTQLRAQFEQGRVGFVEGVGMPEPDRSHFRSLDRWHTASDRGRALNDGWIGRLIAALHPDDVLVPHAVHVGPWMPFALRTRTHPVLTLESPARYRWAVEPRSECASESSNSSLDHVRAVRRRAESSCATVQDAIARHRPRVEYPSGVLASQLRTAAALLLGPCAIDVVSVTHQGYDTHTLQQHRQAKLFGELDAALGAFLEDVRETHDGRDILVLAYSEFGRRVAENASGGTDHGSAGLAFVCGERVRGGFHGRTPSLSELDDGDPIATTDFRSLYGCVLSQGFGIEPETIIAGRWPKLELLT